MDVQSQLVLIFKMVNITLHQLEHLKHHKIAQSVRVQIIYPLVIIGHPMEGITLQAAHIHNALVHYRIMSITQVMEELRLWDV
jgi:hypothetical protein